MTDEERLTWIWSLLVDNGVPFAFAVVVRNKETAIAMIVLITAMPTDIRELTQ